MKIEAHMQCGDCGGGFDVTVGGWWPRPTPTRPPGLEGVHFRRRQRRREASRVASRVRRRMGHRRASRLRCGTRWALRD